jgi:predicted phage terminase large subunit-like protein
MSAILSPTDLNVVLRTDLLSFIEGTFYELYAQADFSNAMHIAIMASRLEACLAGGTTRLVISLPPRSLKSITVSVAFVAWLLGRDPTKQVICASYGQDLAEKHARDTRTIMTSSFYRAIFPATQISPQKMAVNDFHTTQHGFRLATSVGGQLTGRGADIIIIDDPLKPGEALSEVSRTGVNHWYDNTLLSRLNNKQDGIIIIVMQRLHQDDLVGHVLEQEGWEVLSFPAIAVEDERYEISNACGQFVFERKVGEVLDSSRESLETILKIRQAIGSYNFDSQYQQDPSPVGGAIIKTDWFRYYGPEERPERFSNTVQSWDTASKSGEFNDFSVCTTWGVLDRRYYLLDVFRKRLEYPDLRRAVKEQYLKYSPNTVLIEDKGSGTALLQDLQGDGIYGLKAYCPPPGNDKQMRLFAQGSVFENGRVWLPTNAPWLAEYVRELTCFPGTKHDDQVDSTTQALNHLASNNIADLWARLAGY